MPLVLNEEQRLLKETAHEFFASNAPVGALRKLRDNKDKTGYCQQTWQQMAELGWAGITIPEAYGGLEFGALGLGAIIEESGKTLAASPLLATVALSATIIELGGSENQKQQFLPKIASGELTLALALEECAHHNPTSITLTAEHKDDGFILSGEKCFVVDGHTADYLIVAARSSGAMESGDGISLFIIDANTCGIKRRRTTFTDSRNVATVEFDGIVINSDNLIGELHKGWRILEPALDRARIYLAAEMLGGATECFDRTISYLKEREQFGVKIGSFQALKHRCAKIFVDLELARSAVLDALSAIDENRADIAQIASLAKTLINDTYYLVTNEAVQMHGGIGVTDDLDIGLFLKRSRVAIQLFGDSGFHKDRYASLCGY
ncbi:MAG: alkylation response protein AidB-like acyl-CoA dehydrogenase [Flavobacteriales bacterium]|jgi:alkylation response protein AidB-like acyl-CoA dehydrogenase